jgi:IclR family acetate operon transcriptional repressor
VSVLEKTALVLDRVCDAPGPLTLADLARDLKQPRSSVHRMLSDLSTLGVITRMQDASYVPGPRLAHWGEAARGVLDLARISRPFLERLRDLTGESTRVYVRDGNTRVCTAAVEGRFELRHVASVGRRLPLRVGAAGKLLLAFADSGTRVEEISMAVTEPLSASALSGAKLDQQLARIHHTGWSVSIAEREAGLAAAAAAVRDTSGQVVAAMAISGPSSRLTARHLESMRPMIEDIAAGLSAALGYRPATEAQA